MRVPHTLVALFTLAVSVIVLTALFPAVLLAAPQVATPAGSLFENSLIADSSFEGATSAKLPSGWRTPYPDVVGVWNSDKDALHGLKSIRIKSTTSAKSASRRIVALTPGKRYLCSVNVKVKGGQGRAAITVRGAESKSSLGVKHVRPTHETWQKLVFDFVAKSDKAILFLAASGTAGPTFFDLIKLADADTTMGSGLSLIHI